MLFAVKDEQNNGYDRQHQQQNHQQYKRKCTYSAGYIKTNIYN